MTGTTPSKGEVTLEHPSRAERALGRRVAESRATVPFLELSAQVELTVAPGERLRAALVHACGSALRAVPRANAAYRDGAFELYSRVNVGILVASQDSYALATVFDADAKTIETLHHETAELAERARRGALRAPELSGATFSLTDLSGSELSAVSPLIVAPHAAALGAAGVRPVPLVRAGAIVPGHAMTITLACDHRILYGEQASRFLGRVKRTLEAML